MDILSQLLGRLHPVFVHLPIGFIILGILLYYLKRSKKKYRPIVSFIFLLGGISALLTCLTGYLNYQSEGYSYDSIKWHLWLGIVTTFFCFLVYYRLQKQSKKGVMNVIPLPFVIAILFVLISYTGHLGGNITHGEDYLVEPLPNSVKKVLGFETFEKQEIALSDANWKEKNIYEDIINPILNNKCASCHNSKKAKGALVLTSFEHILTGGENGDIIVTNNPDKSELYGRLILPVDNDDRMPPKDKTQLTKDEIKLIETWIKIGNPTKKSIGELQLDKNLFLSFFPKKIDLNYPNIEISPASKEAISAIEQTNVHVENISKNANFLSVTCINKSDFSDTNFETLSKIGNQIAQLDLGNTQITDAIIEKLATLKHLTILKLDHTAITGSTIKKLSDLTYLKSINLTNTEFDIKYLNDFTAFKNLKKVYLFNTNFKSDTVKSLNKGKISIDYGDYELPTIANDTIVY